MCKEVITVTELTTIEEAARLMRKHSIGCLPVLRRNKPVGILTDRDLVIRAIADGLDGWMSRVADVMTRGVHCCSDEASAENVLEQMKRHRIRRIPVISRSGELVGLASLASSGVRQMERTRQPASESRDRALPALEVC